MDARERKALQAAMATVSAALLQLEALVGADLEEAADPPEIACPGCGNTDQERIEETPGLDAPGRLTCLRCGKSWRHQAAPGANEVSNG